MRPWLVPFVVLLAVWLPVATACAQEAEWQRLNEQIDGAVVYSNDGHIWKVEIGDWEPRDMGPGSFARWSPDGSMIAVYHDGAVYVVDRDGSDRRRLASADREDDAPIEFHTNGKEIIYWKEDEGFYTVNVETAESRRLNAPGIYSGEPGISADGKKLVARWDRDLYCIDLEKGTHRKFSRGCAPGVSPSGALIMNNTGDHEELHIRDWDGENRREFDADRCEPDREFDNFHWSNHEDYIAMHGGGRGRHVYVYNVGDPFCAQITKGEGYSPDLYVDGLEMGSAYGKIETFSRPAESVKPIDAPSAEEIASYDRWPGSMQGLVYLWENAGAQNEVLGEDGSIVRTSRARARGAAKFGRTEGMDVTGGAFVAEGVNDALLQSAQQTDQLAIEMVVTPHPEYDEEMGRIVTFSEDLADRMFTLHQDEEGELTFRLRTTNTGRHGERPKTSLGRIPAGEPTHLIITYAPGRLAFYRNGEKVLETDRVRGDFANWEPADLVFGNELEGERDWWGEVEGIALYNRFISEEEAERKYELYRPSLKENLDRPEQIVVVAELESTTPIPDPASIDPYRRALVVNEYTIEEVRDGRLQEDRILVAHWGILDGSVVLPIQELEIDRDYELVLEPFDAHPELESERLLMESDDFLLPLYVDVRPTPSDWLSREAR